MNTTVVCVLLSLVLLLPGLALAETRYISDQLVVTVRSSTGKNYKVLEKLRTDVPVEVLKDDGSFVKVKTKKGNSGYIRSEYVSKKTPKPIRIKELQQQLDKLQAKLEQERLDCLASTEMASSSQEKIDAITQ